MKLLATTKDPMAISRYVADVLAPIFPQTGATREPGEMVVVQGDRNGLSASGDEGSPYILWIHSVPLSGWRSGAVGRAIRKPTVVLFSSLREFEDAERERAHSEAGSAELPDERRNEGVPPFAYLPLPVADRGIRVGGGGAVLWGRPVVEDHVHELLGTLARIQTSSGSGSVPRVRWLVPRADVAAANDLRQRFTGGKSLPVPIIGVSDPAQLHAELRTADIFIRLLHSAIEPIGFELPMALMAAVPSVVLDFADGALLPPGVVFRIAPGARERSEITEILARLDSDQARGELDSVGMQGRAFAREYYLNAVIAGELSRCL